MRTTVAKIRFPLFLRVFHGDRTGKKNFQGNAHPFYQCPYSFYRFSDHSFSLFNNHHDCGCHNIDKAQRKKNLPTKFHQLVIPETRKGCPEPDKNKTENKYFNAKPDGATPRGTGNKTWSQPAPKEKRYNQSAHKNNACVFGHKEKRELHA